MRSALGALAAVVLAVMPALAVTLDVPSNAEQTAETVKAQEEFEVPIGPFQAGQVPMLDVEGRLEQRAWKIIGTTLTTFQLIDPIRAALEEAGFEIKLSCEARECGGFDFRFAIDVLPAPEMFVDIFDYRALSAVAPDGRAVMVLVTRVTTDAFIQITQISPDQTKALGIAKGKVARAEPVANFNAVVRDAKGIGPALVSEGHAVIEGLVFAPGADSLEEASYGSLEALAEFLGADSGRKVMLVGHTDAVGDLNGNIDLSRRRAASVVERLKERYGIAAAQLGAGGMGYLAPRASNLTPEGREKNRRVEAVLLNTE